MKRRLGLLAALLLLGFAMPHAFAADDNFPTRQIKTLPFVSKVAV